MAKNLLVMVEPERVVLAPVTELAAPRVRTALVMVKGTLKAQIRKNIKIER